MYAGSSLQKLEGEQDADEAYEGRKDDKARIERDLSEVHGRHARVRPCCSKIL